MKPEPQLEPINFTPGQSSRHVRADSTPDGPGPDVSADDHHRRSCCRKEKPNRLQGASLPECGARQGVSECYARPLLSLHAVISRSFEKFNACRVFTVQPRCE